MNGPARKLDRGACRRRRRLFGTDLLPVVGPLRPGRPMIDRSSAPGLLPGRTAAAVKAVIEQLRRLRWTSTRIAAALGIKTSTVCAVVGRLDLNRLSRLKPPEPPNPATAGATQANASTSTSRSSASSAVRAHPLAAARAVDPPSRMGLRRQLPRPPAPCCLTRVLQRPSTTQRPRSQNAHQPHPRRRTFLGRTPRGDHCLHSAGPVTALLPRQPSRAAAASARIIAATGGLRRASVVPRWWYLWLDASRFGRAVRRQCSRQRAANAVQSSMAVPWLRASTAPPRAGHHLGSQPIFSPR